MNQKNNPSTTLGARKIKGFTLIETMVYISIATILFLSLTSFVIFMKNSENDFDSKWAIERESRKIFSIMEIVLNNTIGIDLPNNGNTDNRVVLNMRTPVNGQNEIYLENNNLFWDNNGAVEQINSSDVFVTNFIVYNLSDSNNLESFKISFTLNSTTTQNSVVSDDFNTSFTIRDYE